MTKQELEAIWARCEAATPGPWNYDERINCVAVYAGEKMDCLSGFNSRCIVYVHSNLVDGRYWELSEQKCRDAYFVANSRTDIPALLAEVERLQAENAELLGYAKGMCTACAHRKSGSEWDKYCVACLNSDKSKWQWRGEVDTNNKGGVC